MKRPVAVAALLAVASCGTPPVAYLTLSGAITLPAPTGQLAGAPISIASLAGDVAGASQAAAEQTTSATPEQPATGRYTLELDRTTLPLRPTLFVVALHNHESPPRDGPLLEAVVALSGPPGTGPDPGTERVDLDATSSLAAMAIEYRQSLGDALDATLIAPPAIAVFFGRQTSLPFDLATAFGKFVSGQTNTAPCDSATLAQRASQALPKDLSTVR